MIGSAIREVSCAREAPFVAAAFFERIVQIWNLDTHQLIAQYDSPFGFGGKRLYLNDSGTICLAASWKSGEKGGLAAYDARTGALLWRNAFRAKTQRISRAADADFVWVLADSGNASKINCTTGAVTDELLRIDFLFESRRGDLRITAQKKGSSTLKVGNKSVSLPSQNILAAECSDGRVFLSERASCVRCYDFDGIERWRFDPGPGSHVIDLWYSDRDTVLYAYVFYFKSRAMGGKLVSIDDSDGVFRVLRQGIDTREVDASIGSNYVVTRDGEVMQLNDGASRTRLAFPTMQYPDSL